jgi:hypothetical protein
MSGPKLKVVNESFQRLLSASLFLSELDPRAERFTFQALPDAADRGDPKLGLLRLPFDAALPDVWDKVEKLNDQGAGIFVTANQTHLNGKRCNEEIMWRRAVWCDYDDPAHPPPEFPLKPSLIVNTSPGKYQFWWLVEGCLAVDDFTAVMGAMVERYGADPNAKDQARLLRLPGTFHRKGEPVEVTWDYGARAPDGNARRYTPLELLDAFTPEQSQQSQQHSAEPRAPQLTDESELARVADALRFVPPEKRETWFDVMCALHPFGEAGYTVLEEWAKRTTAKNYDAKRQRYEWGKLKDDKANGTTVRSIYGTALANGWKPQRTSAEDDFADIEIAGNTANGNTADEKQGKRKLLIFPREITTERIVERDRNALVRHLLYPGDTVLLYGASGECKSFLGADLGWHLAMGRGWHGRPVKQVPVLYAALEGVDGFQKRLRALTEVHGDPGDMFAQLAIPVSLATGDAGEAGLKLLLAAAEELKTAAGMPVGLIVIDTMARALAGDDENAAKETMHFLEKRIGAIARKTGAAVMTVHHENKAGDIRGCAALKAGCDLVMHSDNRVLTVEKAKDDAATALFAFELAEVQVATAYDGKPIMSCMGRYTTGETDPKRAGATRRQAFSKVLGGLTSVYRHVVDPDGQEAIWRSSDPLAGFGEEDLDPVAEASAASAPSFSDTADTADARA